MFYQQQQPYHDWHRCIAQPGLHEQFDLRSGDHGRRSKCPTGCVSMLPIDRPYHLLLPKTHWMALGSQIHQCRRRSESWVLTLSQTMGERCRDDIYWPRGLSPYGAASLRTWHWNHLTRHNISTLNGDAKPWYSCCIPWCWKHHGPSFRDNEVAWRLTGPQGSEHS